MRFFLRIIYTKLLIGYDHFHIYQTGDKNACFFSDRVGIFPNFGPPTPSANCLKDKIRQSIADDLGYLLLCLLR